MYYMTGLRLNGSIIYGTDESELILQYHFHLTSWCAAFAELDRFPNWSFVPFF